MDTHPNTPCPSAACRIRPATLTDAVALSTFAARTFVDTYGIYNRPEDLAMHLASSYQPAHQVREIADADVATFIACSGSELAAYAQVRRGEPVGCVADRAAVELHRFYVDRSWHGRGLSQRLLHEVRRAAQEKFAGATLWLKVWERNRRAIAFYAKSGFVDVGSANFVVGTDTQTDRVLSMPLLR